VNALVVFSEHSAGTITVERSLHEGFLKNLGLTRGEEDQMAPTPTTLAYTSYLLKTASLGNYPELLGAVLPYYWIYQDVGKSLLESASLTPCTRGGSTPTAARSSAPSSRLF
jgi:thiaminase/transcriptional activator TenA